MKPKRFWWRQPERIQSQSLHRDSCQTCLRKGSIYICFVWTFQKSPVVSQQNSQISFNDLAFASFDSVSQQCHYPSGTSSHRIKAKFHSGVFPLAHACSISVLQNRTVRSLWTKRPLSQAFQTSADPSRRAWPERPAQKACTDQLGGFVGVLAVPRCGRTPSIPGHFEVQPPGSPWKNVTLSLPQRTKVQSLLSVSLWPPWHTLTLRAQDHLTREIILQSQFDWCSRYQCGCSRWCEFLTCEPNACFLFPFTV